MIGILNVMDLRHLQRRTIGLVKDYGNRNTMWTANGTKFIESLKELGWLTPDSVEYADMRKRFEERDRIERTIEGAKSMLHTVYFGGKVSQKITDIIAKKPDKIERFRKVKEAILLENSPRARILRSFNSYDRKITRDDLRKILMLKD